MVKSEETKDEKARKGEEARGWKGLTLYGVGGAVLVALSIALAAAVLHFLGSYLTGTFDVGDTWREEGEAFGRYLEAVQAGRDAAFRAAGVALGTAAGILAVGLLLLLASSRRAARRAREGGPGGGAAGAPEGEALPGEAPSGGSGKAETSQGDPQSVSSEE